MIFFLITASKIFNLFIMFSYYIAESNGHSLIYDNKWAIYSNQVTNHAATDLLSITKSTLYYDDLSKDCKSGVIQLIFPYLLMWSWTMNNYIFKFSLIFDKVMIFLNFQ